VHPILKRVLHGGGTLLAIAGIILVALQLWDQAAEINLTRFSGTTWLVIVGLALIYGLANLLLALAWWNLLNQFDVRASLRWTVKAYGISQIAKYVPGNIMHLAGRQALGLAVGLPGWPLAKSTAWELGLIAFTGAIFGALALPLLIAKFPVLVALALFLAALGGAAALLWHIIGPPVARALGWHAVFLAISGVLFVALVHRSDANADGSGTLLLPMIGAYVLAWLAGLVTPGAPAGVGIRELVLLALLHGVVGQTELLLAVVLGRLVTVGGDLAFLGMAVAIGARNAPTTQVSP
jgi:hypothetical protein